MSRCKIGNHGETCSHLEPLLRFRSRSSGVTAATGFHPMGGQNPVWESGGRGGGNRGRCELGSCLAEHLKKLLIPNGRCRHLHSVAEERNWRVMWNFHARSKPLTRCGSQTHCTKKTRSTLVRVLTDRSCPNGRRRRVDQKLCKHATRCLTRVRLCRSPT